MAGIYDEINSQRIRAKKALVAGRYDEAITQAELILMDLASIPDGQKEGDAGARLEWDREAILAFIDLAKQKRADGHVGSNPMGMTTHPIQNIATRPSRNNSHRSSGRHSRSDLSDRDYDGGCCHG